MTPSLGKSGTLSDLRERVAAVPWVGAVATGILAFPVGYVLLGLVVVLGGGTSGDILGVLVLIGFIFYSAFNVPVAVSNGSQVDYLAAVADPATPAPAVPLLVYYAVPIVVLVVAGGLASSRFSRNRLDPVETGVTVLGLAIGFGVMAVVGSFAFVSTTLSGGTAKIALFEAGLFGLLYPLVFGLLGAGLLQMIRAFRVGG